MPNHQEHHVHGKALALNLDHTTFGSFAEIGAGQEVARWFLRVGGASGTVAKTISAYDKEVSDQLYGTGTRYVSKQRLRAMLESEWTQLLAQLQATRGSDTRFFAFVDTIAARNYSGTNDCHGWLGLRFQQEPGLAPNEIILHVNLRDKTNVQQQEAVGILGVNLLYAAYHALGSGEEFVASIFEELSLHRVEIDQFEWNGKAFDTWNRNAMHAWLVGGGYAEAIAFSADGELVPPNEFLYKRAVVLAPGRFDTVTELHAHLITDTLAQLPEEEVRQTKGGLGLFCLSVPEGVPIDRAACTYQILEHVQNLSRLGYGVMVFRARELYAMSAFVNRYTQSRIHFSIGLTVLVRMFEDRYADLPGTVLEGLARLFTLNVRLSVHPMLSRDLQKRAAASGLSGWRWTETNGMVTADNLHPAGPLDSLYQYLQQSGFIIPEKPGTALSIASQE